MIACLIRGGVCSGKIRRPTSILRVMTVIMVEGQSQFLFSECGVGRLHGVFRHHPGRYALALPDVSPGKAHGPVRILRVFAENRDDLDTLVALISGQPIIRDYTRAGATHARCRMIFQRPWIEYRRYRIPSKEIVA